VVTPGVPPLENGDRLTRAEFERRHNAMPHVKKAELIEGVVRMPSAVHFGNHAEPHSYIIGWLFLYCASTPAVRPGDNATVRLDADNEVQPDALLRLEPEVGGQSSIGEDDFVEGAPELIVEIAASSASYDLHDKKKVYRRNEVQEYVVWRVYDGALDWYRLREGEYVLLEADEEGIVHSELFPGLWLDVAALLKGDLGRVLAVVQEGVNSAEHAAFAERLAGA
jgi:Uma2 family endonuclease